MPGDDLTGVLLLGAATHRLAALSDGEFSGLLLGAVILLIVGVAVVGLIANLSKGD